MATIFSKNESIQKDLSRVHKLLSNQCNQEIKSIKDEDEQTNIIKMMGSTLLPEEFFFVGFLPLQSFIDTKKDIKNGVKCPLERESLVRTLLLKDHLESLKCTMEDLKAERLSYDMAEKQKQQEEQKETDNFFS